MPEEVCSAPDQLLQQSASFRCPGTTAGNLTARITSNRAFSHTLVESRTGAVVWGRWPTLRFPSPLIELDVPISGIQLSDQFHREAFDVAIRGRRSRRSR